MTELSDAHKLIRDTARRVAREKIAPRAAELDESGEYPQDIFAAYRDVGLLGLSIPQEYGGSGAGFLALALAVEEIAKYCNSSALILLLPALSHTPLTLRGPAPRSSCPRTRRASRSPARTARWASSACPRPTSSSRAAASRRRTGWARRGEPSAR